MEISSYKRMVNVKIVLYSKDKVIPKEIVLIIVLEKTLLLILLDNANNAVNIKEK